MYNAYKGGAAYLAENRVRGRAGCSSRAPKLLFLLSAAAILIGAAARPSSNRPDRPRQSTKRLIKGLACGVYMRLSQVSHSLLYTL